MASTLMRAKHKHTGAEFVIHTVKRPFGQVNTDLQANILKREESIRKAIDHPHILKLHETFENEREITYVLEPYHGCDLVSGIAEAQFFAEPTAAVIMQQILCTVAYLHSSRINHRNLNHEVFSFSHDIKARHIKDNSLKLTDMSRSKWIMQANNDDDDDMTLLGHSYFTAPEAWTTEYNCSIDMWSCGVILYCLLCGYLPFDGPHQTEVLDKIKTSCYEFPEDVWGSISHDAKDLISDLLQVEYWERSTAKDALGHVWVKELAPRYRLDEFGKTFFETLSLGPQRLSKFKEVALELVSESLDDGHVESLQDIFQAADIDGNGYLSLAEMEKAILTSDADLPKSVHYSLNNVDVNGDGYISFSEFLAVAVDNSMYLKTHVLRKAFNHFDSDGSGTVSLKELQTVLANPEVSSLIGQDSCGIAEMFRDADTDNNGNINFEEFKKMMLTSSSY